MEGGRLFTLRGGRVVTHSSDVRADVVIEDGRIRSVGEVEPGGDVIDASGLLVMPGMVDTHVHLMDPGPTDREDFPTGTRAAAARGVTTIVEHTHAAPVLSADDLSSKRQHLEGRANVDFALAAHTWPDRLDLLEDTWRAGAAFFKIFTCTTHGVPGLDAAHLLAAMRRIAAMEGRCLVHCEDESITAEAERALLAGGRRDPGVLPEWRNREAEAVAIAEAAVLAEATGVSATFAHVSSLGVLELIEEARRRGADIAAEACPQYFVLEEDEVVEHGALRKFTPPARLRSGDEREQMWEAVRERRFSHFSTDHAPSTKEQKLKGDIWEAPFGLPGIDTTLPFLLDAALSGRIGLTDVADLYSFRPARRYGLRGKGLLEAGADADLVLVDPEASWTLRDEDVISKAGWSPYSGMTFRGRVVATYLRGEEVARDGRSHDLRSGAFVPGAGAAGGER